MIARCLFLLAALLCRPALAGEVGFTTVQVPDPPGEDLAVGIWYPTEQAATPHRLDLYTQTVAADAAIAGTGHPLVVMSHGTGGSYAGHYDTALALARAGFVVAAMTHTGDNYRDTSRVTRLGFISAIYRFPAASPHIPCAPFSTERHRPSSVPSGANWLSRGIWSVT